MQAVHVVEDTEPGETCPVQEVQLVMIELHDVVHDCVPGL